MSAVQSYMRTTAAKARETERIGPFLATFSRSSANPFLNYAIPDDGAVPTRADVDGLTEAYRKRDLIPRLEFLGESMPEVEPVVLAAGYQLERRVPLMVCPRGEVAAQPLAEGFELLTPESDEEYLAMMGAQSEAFDDPDPITPEALAGQREMVANGGLAVLARHVESGEGAGGGLATPMADGTIEVAGFGVRAKYRRQGLAAALTEYLTSAAHERGAHTVFLTPAGVPEERIYAKVGFRPAGSFVNLRLE